MEDGITASLYTYLTDLTVFAKSEGIPMGTHSLHKIERQHIKMPPLGAKVPDPYAPQSYGKRHKKPSAKPGNRVPRVKVLNYLKKVALFFLFISLSYI
jgi:hypothetical protein